MCAAYFSVIAVIAGAIVRLFPCFFCCKCPTIFSKRRCISMTAKERILALKLLQLQKRNPEYTQRIGVQVRIVKTGPKRTEE